MELYHATRAELVPTIENKGLVPKRPFARPEKLKAVYLTKFPFKWMFNATCMGEKKGALIKVRVDHLKLLPDIHTDIRDKDIEKDGDFLCLEKIGPEWITEIAIEREDKKGEFIKWK